MQSEKTKENWQNLTHLLSSFDWEQTREKVSRESRARVLLVGLAGAGKSTLFNQLCGWAVSPAEERPAPGRGLAEPVEDYGLFCLVDLPDEPYGNGSNGHTAYGLPHDVELLVPDRPGAGPDGLPATIPLGGLSPLELAEGADLLVYVVDGAAGARTADYRWVGRLRRLGLPLLVVLNKSDLLGEDLAGRRAEMEARLATGVLAVSAQHGHQVTGQLLPKMVSLCPGLLVALGRELSSFRRQAARRLIHQAALVNAVIALEPVPLLDLPVQVMTLTGLMLRLAAIYDRPAGDVRRREVIAAVAGGLAGRYGAQQVAKLVPLAGWLLSSALGWSCTWGLGRAAIAYFESGGDETIDRGWSRARNEVARRSRSLYRRWQERVWRSLAGNRSRTGPARREEVV